MSFRYIPGKCRWWRMSVHSELSNRGSCHHGLRCKRLGWVAKRGLERLVGFVVLRHGIWIVNGRSNRLRVAAGKDFPFRANTWIYNVYLASVPFVGALDAGACSILKILSTTGISGSPHYARGSEGSTACPTAQVLLLLDHVKYAHELRNTHLDLVLSPTTLRDCQNERVVCVISISELN